MLPDIFNIMFGSPHFDSQGQVVAVLVDGYQTKGYYSFKWNAHKQPSGIYLYKLKADG
ncbi:MAG TPA: hypothetical protein VGD14_02365 [bacterium]